MPQVLVTEAARFPGKYLSLATFRRDGTAVATPVWFAQDGGLLLVWTNEQTGKVKRIRRNPSVTIAPCTATGRLRGQPLPAQARLLPAGEASRAEALLARKYRYDMALLRALEAVIGLARRRRRTAGARVYIEITPADAGAASARQG